MNGNVLTFLANLKHDIRNRQSVEVGSGIFKGQELVDVAQALEALPGVLTLLEQTVDTIRGMRDEVGLPVDAQGVVDKAQAALTTLGR